MRKIAGDTDGAAHRHRVLVSNSASIKGVTFKTALLPPGEAVHELEGEHSFGIAPNYPTITPLAAAGGPLRDIPWDPLGVGYLPPYRPVHSVVLEPAEATYIRVPDRIFRAAAFETVDANNLELRWMGNIADPAVISIFETMKKVEQSPGIASWPLIMESLGTAISVSIMRHLGASPLQGDVPYPTGLPQDRLSRVLDYIEANLDQPITLTELAGAAFLSTFHFTRAFRKSMNVSPVKYVWQRRVLRAKESLSSTMTPLAAIAYESGFSSQSHFSTMFKREVGVTPLQYRANFFRRVMLSIAAASTAMCNYFIELSDVAQVMA